MGYTTEFKGRFDLNKPLTEAHAAYLRQFAETRRMKRSPKIVEMMPDPVRIAVGLPIGEEGGYFVGGTGFAGQDHDASIVEYNHEPAGQPGLWCKWEPTKDGAGIAWSGTEKFYNYTEWLAYLIEHFLRPWGYVVNGDVNWQGEKRSDKGTLSCKDNVVTAGPRKAKPKKVPKPLAEGDTVTWAAAGKGEILRLYEAPGNTLCAEVALGNGWFYDELAGCFTRANTGTPATLEVRAADLRGES